MTDTLDQDTNGEGGEPLDPRLRDQLRQAKQVQRERDEALAELAKERRENVFAQVGIPTSGAGALFRQAYQGDLDLAFVKAAAESYEVLAPAGQSTQDQGMSSEERAAAQRIAGAGTGIPPAGSNVMADFAAKIQAVPYNKDNPQESQRQVMELVHQMEDAHPELGRYTNPNN